MTPINESERLNVVIDAASTLRAPVDPPYDLWPEIMSRARIRRRGSLARMMVVTAIILLIVTVTTIVVSQSQRGSTEKSLEIANARIELEVAASIASDHYRAQKLSALARYARQDAAFARSILEATKPISSSRDKMSVLIALAETNALSSKELRTLYLDVARSIISTGDRDQAIAALTQ